MTRVDGPEQRWQTFGAAYLWVAGLALLAGIIETVAASSRGTLALLDLLYGINLHLILALVITAGLRLVFWRATARRFLLLAIGGLLLVEFGVVLAYWLNLALGVPPIATLKGKLFSAVLVAGGALLALVLTGLIARRLHRTPSAPPERFGGSGSRTDGAQALRALHGGAAGVLLAALLVVVNVALVWRALPRESARAIPPEISALERPDVIVILIDTLRRDHVSFFDYSRPTTPRIDELFESCYVFSNAYTPSNWTVPSVASIFTGLYPTSHGVYGHYLSVPDQALTLAEVFRAYGYETGAFIDNPAISVANQFDQGFGVFYPSWSPWWSRGGRTFLEHLARGHAARRTQASWTRSHGPQVNVRFFEWIDSQVGGSGESPAGQRVRGRGTGHAPLFGYVHFMEPHHPYRPPQALRESVAAGAPRGPDRTPHLLRYLDDEECRDWECLSDPPRMGAEELRGMIANYDGDVRWADELVGELVAGLRERGILERCHLLIFSDHGEEFFDHRGWRHTYSIYEEVSGCVLAYRPPGGAARRADSAGGMLIERPVAALDLARSLFDILGFEPPPQHQGRPIPELFGAAPPRMRQPVLCELPPHLYSLRLGEWKLVQRGRLDDPDSRLFHFPSDPAEQNDLAAAHPDTLQMLQGYLEGLRAELSRVSLGEREAITDPKALERLRALGYLQ